MLSDRPRVPPQSSPPPQASQPLASWYMPGFSDGLGNRLLMFDNTRAPAWELLRLRADFATAPRFETALRASVEQLAAFRHTAFSTVRCVDERTAGGGVAIVSSYESGRRLSETLERPRSAGVAIHLLRQITPAIATLHRQGLAHGVLTVDRIVLAPRGRVLVRDHALGSAIDTLQWSASRLWVELGVIAPANLVAPLSNPRTDVIQIGLIALSVMSGRRIDPTEHPGQIGRVLDKLEKMLGLRNPTAFQALRTWLLRALQLQAPSFESAEDASEALRDWSEEAAAEEADFELPTATASTRAALFGERSVESPRQLPARPVAAQRTESVTERAPQLPPSPPRRAAPPPAIESRTTGELLEYPSESATEPKAAPVLEPRLVPSQAIALRSTHRAASTPWTRHHTSLHLSDDVEMPSLDADASSEVSTERSAGSGSARALRITAAASLLVAIAEAVALMYLLVFRGPAAPAEPLANAIAAGTPGTPGTQGTEGTTIDPAAGALSAVEAPSTSASPAGPGPQRGPRVGRDEPRVASELAARPRPQEAAPAPATMRVSSPIDLQVFEGDRLLGSTRGTVQVPPGRHRLVLVNKELGYSVRRIVDVVPGQALSLTVTPGNGSVNINATPWAEVWVNGTSIGVTPLARVSMPLGEHEFVFRHPQLGERRKKARVRSGNVTSVTIELGS